MRRAVFIAAVSSVFGVALLAPPSARAAARQHCRGQGFVSTMSIHGSATADQHIFFDGMNIGQNLTGTGSQSNGVTVNEPVGPLYFNPQAITQGRRAQFGAQVDW